MIYVIGIFTSFFLAFIALTKKGRTLADAMLGIWMIFIGLHLFAYYSYIAKLTYHMHLLGFGMPLPFLHGPFLYLYTLALSKPEKFKTKQWLYHFSLPLIFLLWALPFAFYPASEKLAIIQTNGKGYEYYSVIQPVVLSLSGIYYVFITSRLLSQHKRRVLNQFSNQEKINLDWLRFLFYGMAIMWILIIGIGNDQWIFSVATIFVIFIGYFGIRQVGIFTNKTIELSEVEPDAEVLMATEAEQPSVEKRKYAKSGLNETISQGLHQRLKEIMQTEKLYTNPELTLTDLAARLNIHPNHLSQVINEIEGVNFYDYINYLRIEEFKRLVALPENQKFTLLALAFDCGFNSKSVFNRFFKKATNLSPSEYVKQLEG